MKSKWVYRRLTFKEKARQLVGKRVVVTTTNGTFRGVLYAVEYDYLTLRRFEYGSYRKTYIRIAEIVSLRRALTSSTSSSSLSSSNS
ncbi:DUF2642 domain-containing protein [Alicyclobacillus tolerans]|uniref:Uncharacterized protein n=1 Tax=Alicyclobacillus tolerans TaxID=90970 RepID=A0A1M6N896_9BACL|nr:DUF2642 domain-containing protein [Alicyclobacillus montanus]SHJ91939.1 Protein of unknown function [Alicyclobacillus montanus]